MGELDALAQALRESHRRYSICDIHNVGAREFKYPASIRLFERYIRLPMFDANNDGYLIRSVLYADLDGNGRIEAIVQLARGATRPPAGDCGWRGQGSIFVFEMDEKCVVHRLAWIQGTSFDNQRIEGKTLLVDQPRFTTGRDASSCQQIGAAHFFWRFKAGKLLRL